MKLSFRIIFKIFVILTILAGCATTEEIKETNPDVLVHQGIAFGEEGQYDRAIAYFNKALDINPRSAEAYNNRGVTYGQGKGQTDKAIADYSQAIEINPRYANAYSNRGVAYFFKGFYERAWDDVHKAESLGWQVHPGFLKALREASGRQK